MTEEQWLRVVEFLKTLPMRLQFDYRSPTEAGVAVFTKQEVSS